MKINKIEIGAFGKFTNYTMVLDDGFQIIFGGNEDGKSTIMAFIKIMFYGNQGRSRELLNNIRKKYSPWDRQPMNGAIEFESESINYRLQKDFGETYGKDKVVLINVNTGETVPLGKDEEVGKRFFGVNLSAFERSSFIGQIGNISSGSKDDDVTERLMANLIQTGDETTRHQTVIDRLTAAKEDLISKNDKNGRLIQLRNELIILNDEKIETQQKINEQADLLEQYQKLKKDIEYQKELTAKLAGSELGKKASQLDDIIAKTKIKQKLVEDLIRPGLDITSLPNFIGELQDLVSNSKAAKESLEKLQLASSDDLQINRTEITVTEHEKANSIHNKIKELDNIISLFNATVLPTAEDFLQKHNALNNSEVSLNLAENDLDNISYKNKKNEVLTLEISELNRKLVTILKEDNANSLTKNRSNKYVFFALSLLFCVVSVLAFFITGQVFTLLGLLISFILLIVPLFTKKNNNLNDMRQDDIENINALILKAETAQQALIDDIYKDTEIKKAADNLINTHNTATIDYKTALESYKRNKQHFLTQIDMLSLKLDHSFLPNNPINFNPVEVIEKLTCEKNKLVSELSILLSEKNCSRIDEFNELFLQFQSNYKNNTAATSALKQFELSKQELFKYLSPYLYTDDLDAALLAITKLNKNYLEFNNIDFEIKNIAKGMGITFTDLDDLISKRNELVNFTTNYEDPIDSAYARAELNKLEEMNLHQQMLDISVKLKSPKRPIEQIENEIKIKTETETEMAAYYKGVVVALNVMNESLAEIRNNFSPDLNRITGDILVKITNGKYSQIKVDKEYRAQIKSGVHFREYEYLSSGTIDQAYLSLRLAISQMIAGERNPLPIFLDDVLMQYDEERAEHCLRFLFQYAAFETKSQIILLTCHNHILQKADKLAIYHKNL